MATTPQTVQYSRMTRQQALDALTVVNLNARTHALTCAQCWHASQAKKARATSWATWTPCAESRAFARTKLALEHRLHYLRQNAVKIAAKAHDMTPWQWQREYPRDYAQLVAEYGLEGRA